MNTDFPVVFYRAIAALGCRPSSTILCIHVHSHWHWYSFLYGLSYHDHVYICALAQSYIHCRCSSLLSFYNKCLTSYSSPYFSNFERKVNWTNLNFALCLGEKLMGNVYILREKMIGHVYSLQLFSPFNFSFH